MPKEVVAHRTGNANPRATAIMHYNYFAGGYRESSAHYFVDAERILRIIPEDEVAWHAGAIANHRAIGVELCENFPPGTPQFAEAYKRYVWLVADICKRHNIDVATGVRGHFEYDPVNRAEDPHGLLARHFGTAKEEAWNRFKADVAKALSPGSSWDQVAELEVLFRSGLIVSRHRPDDVVTWGQFATVLNRMRGGVS